MNKSLARGGSVEGGEGGVERVWSVERGWMLRCRGVWRCVEKVWGVERVWMLRRCGVLRGCGLWL